MKIKCIKTYKHTHTWNLVWLTKNPPNEKVKLGWGWHPKFFTTTTIKFHMLRLQSFDHETWSSLWNACPIKGLQEIVKSHPIKGF